MFPQACPKWPRQLRSCVRILRIFDSLWYFSHESHGRIRNAEMFHSFWWPVPGITTTERSLPSSAEATHWPTKSSIAIGWLKSFRVKGNCDRVDLLKKWSKTNDRNHFGCLISHYSILSDLSTMFPEPRVQSPVYRISNPQKKEVFPS